jgi:hypothetical protein
MSPVAALGAALCVLLAGRCCAVAADADADASLFFESAPPEAELRAMGEPGPCQNADPGTRAAGRAHGCGAAPESALVHRAARSQNAARASLRRRGAL